MRSYRDTTPRLIQARFPSACFCGRRIKAGDEVLYYPASKKTECRECATPTLNMLADERNMLNI